MDVQNTANGHLASLRVTEGVFPNDLDSLTARCLRDSTQRNANVLAALCLTNHHGASTPPRVARAAQGDRAGTSLGGVAGPEAGERGVAGPELAKRGGGREARGRELAQRGGGN
jgi:hypothetical protein